MAFILFNEQLFPKLVLGMYFNNLISFLILCPLSQTYAAKADYTVNTNNNNRINIKKILKVTKKISGKNTIDFTRVNIHITRRLYLPTYI